MFVHYNRLHAAFILFYFVLLAGRTWVLKYPLFLKILWFGWVFQTKLRGYIGTTDECLLWSFHLGVSGWLTWVLGLTACSSAQTQNHPQKLSQGEIWRLVFPCCFCIVPGDLLSPLPKFSTCTCSSYAIGLTFYTWLMILTSELVRTYSWSKIFLGMNKRCIVPGYISNVEVSSLSTCLSCMRCIWSLWSCFIADIFYLLRFSKNEYSNQ